jgi:hypothetical protein
VKRLAIVVIAACGSRAPAPEPPKPKPVDTKALAADLDIDLKRLADIAHRHRGDCDGLIPELEAHASVMKTHAAEVKRAQQDPAVAKQLKVDVQAYDEGARGVSTAIAEDLAASFQVCGDNKARLQRAVDQIPDSMSE